MMRSWIAVALLSLSWMLGLEYYTPPSGWLWTVVVATAIVLLADSPQRRPDRSDAGLVVLLTLPALWLFSWPYRAIPLALLLGLLPALMSAPAWLTRLGWGAVRSSVILAAQAVALRGYALVTARNHDLPWPGSECVALLARLLGSEAATDGSTVVLFSPSGPQRLAVTWELVLDPVTVGLAIGAFALVSVWLWEDRTTAGRHRWRDVARLWLQQAGRILGAFALWIPLRLALLLGLFLHREMRAPEVLKSTVMNQFFSPWVLAAASLGAVAALTWTVRRGVEEAPSEDAQPQEPPPLRFRIAAAAIAVVLVALATTLLFVDPIGKPKGGRVMFVERHSDWEPTDQAYDTQSYGHDPSYSYTNIYRYCGQYFDVSRLQDDETINRDRLSECDVLVIKTPTEAYGADEVRAVLRFVERGGGLLLIGEHTDFMRSSTYLNAVAEPLGFKFRPDILFTVGDPYTQFVTPRQLPHPAVRNVPPMMYAGSCSIDPGGSRGRAAVWNTGLWSRGANYNAENFFPFAEYDPEMRFGAFIQLWETRHGKGRVLAFTDSTIFSNFSSYQPGTAELMLDMISWLNRRSALDSTALRGLIRLAGIGVLVAAACLAVTRCPRTEASWLMWFAATLLGSSLAVSALAAWQRGALPERERPLVCVTIDRTVSNVPLSNGPFTDEPHGYGLLEQWIPRLGHCTVRAEGADAFRGDVLLVISPTGSVSEDYRHRLIDWVAGGGKLIVFDSPDSVGTTANSLLWPFGLAVYHATSARGKLVVEGGEWPGVELQATCSVEGGEPLMRVGETVVAARTRYGDGSVTAIGFGALMNNESMGGTWDMDPGPYHRLVYNILYELIDSVVEGRPVAAPSPSGRPVSRLGERDETGTGDVAD